MREVLEEGEAVIYLVQRTELDWDEHDAFVVRASSPDDARRLAAAATVLKEDPPGFGPRPSLKVWLDAECRELVLDGDAEVLLARLQRG